LINSGAELERSIAMSFMGDTAVGSATWPSDKRKAVVAASVIDCVGACVYFLVTLGLILLARRRAEDADTHTVTIHDYSVYVHRLPQDATSNELVDFFGQWGEVRFNSAAAAARASAGRLAARHLCKAYNGAGVFLRAAAARMVTTDSSAAARFNGCRSRAWS
jgi:hypothetical protein